MKMATWHITTHFVVEGHICVAVMRRSNKFRNITFQPIMQKA